MDREIIEWKVKSEDSRSTTKNKIKKQNQKVKVHVLIEEHYDAFSL